MKTTITTTLLSLLLISGFAQELKFDVHSTYSRPVTQETLINAKTMNDITPGYPSSWISNYISVEFVATCNGKEIKAAGKNEILTTEQKDLLAKADLGTNIKIDIKYTYNNSVLDENVFQNMVFAVTVAPQTQAEYVGGYAEMTDYLKENAINKISDTKTKQFTGAVIRFTVDENGKVADAYVIQPSADQKTDRLLLKAIHKMPKWKAAQMANGTKVKQEFEFTVGSPMMVGC